MAIYSGMFMSVNGDRRYQAWWFAKFFGILIGNGVFPNPSTGMQVFENENMTVTIKPGDGWINGYYIHSDSDYVLQHDLADGVLKRIDRVVMRLDFSEREIGFDIKKGTFASNPVAPSLQRNADAWELALADVLINNGATQITQAHITDQRLNSTLCGIVHGTVDQVDTTTIFNQYQAWMQTQIDLYEGDLLAWTDDKKAEFEQWQQLRESDFDAWQAQEKSDFDAWFLTIQDILDGNVAGNLQNQITQLGNRVTAVENSVAEHKADLMSQEVGKGADKIGLPDPNNLFTATHVGGAMQELFTNVSDGKSLVGRAITDVDENVVIPTEPSFQDLASAIGQISTGKKWARGSKISSSQQVSFVTIDGTGNAWEIKVDGLDFTPSLIIVWTSTTTPRPSTIVDLSRGNTIHVEDSSSVFLLQGRAYVNETGFLLPIMANNIICYWVAFE